jgi:hypothetical protein
MTQIEYLQAIWNLFETANNADHDEAHQAWQVADHASSHCRALSKMATGVIPAAVWEGARECGDFEVIEEHLAGG